jgi:surface carbohydrate biosynthesis protein
MTTSNGRRRVLILVPNRWRDLDGHVLVAYRLHKFFGHEVLLCGETALLKTFLEFAPDVVVIDHLGIESRANLARIAKSLGAQLVVLPTAGFFQDRIREARRAGKLFGVAHLVDRYLAWGESTCNHLLRERLMTIEQLRITGCVRFDFYSERYFALMKPKSVVLRGLGFEAADGPLVMWTTSTYFANLPNPEEVVRSQTLQAKRPADEVWAEIADCVTQFTEHSQIVLQLAKRNPNWNVVIRVHPTETSEPYQALCQQADNIRISTRESVRELLYHCDVLLQRGCTTATEAWMLGKPVLELEKGSYHNAMSPEYSSGNDVVWSFEQAQCAIEQYLAGAGLEASIQSAREDYIRKAYHLIDGNSSQRAAEAINECISPPSYSDAKQEATRRAINQEFSRWTLTENRRFANRVKDVLGIDRELSLRFWKTIRARNVANSFGLMTSDNSFTYETVRPLLEQYQYVCT